ncbi:MAG: ATP synthase F1 subunit delta [Candidatus Doudnabacteria bacterium RIFCSPHIGHO2_01_FULL_49_9]|uniref:ATP synthase subunit delta n=1 Tax=Candidatus Doudnabacteria bacterium RIFCSPHIGHO2_01_FULL_49_9 TaxID=1817827 RepID=A0A1F5P267_9BACT|nr:MAG: ATP synthase F1 subunit delta [Candidatus Doudnabacteria bacterium RIFCSPHIGHO2_01_FULL_49_9]
MKYSPKQYAQALHESLAGTKPADHERVIDNFVQVLKQHGDLGRFAEIEAVYVEYEKSSRGISTAKVATAHKLSENEEAKLIHRLNHLLDSQVEIKQQVDEGLLGGIVVRMDDKLIDGSVRRNLKDLKTNLSR